MPSIEGCYAVRKMVRSTMHKAKLFNRKWVNIHLFDDIIIFSVHYVEFDINLKHIRLDKCCFATREILEKN